MDKNSKQSAFQKHLALGLHQGEELQRIAHALSSELRIRILQEVSKHSLSVQELAHALNEPLSTVALNVTKLEESKLLITEQLPGKHGMQKRCSRLLDEVDIDLRVNANEKQHSGQISMPIGAFSLVGGIHPTCGIADAQGIIGSYDDPRSFYLPERLHAQLIWFRQGYVEYLFPTYAFQNRELLYLELFFEACSETINYNNNFKSDIFVSFNGVELGTWESPGDLGGRKGLLTPPWWSEIGTQYGILKTWRVTGEGSFLENEPLSGVTLADLRIPEHDALRVRIGVHPDAPHVGGINLFGEHFGDVPLALVLNYGCVR